MFHISIDTKPVKQQYDRERRYSCKPFTVTSKTSLVLHNEDYISKVLQVLHNEDFPSPLKPFPTLYDLLYRSKG